MKKYTGDEILEMPAGTEMDALIVENVFGLIPDYEVAEYYHGRPFVKGLRDKYNGALPFYSTYIDSAWEVVEKINRMWNISRLPTSEKWLASFIDKVPILEAEADIASLAICRAALLSVMEVE